MTTIPASHLDLLRRPIFGHLATMRPDGQIQVNPMWYVWDGTHLRFTTSSNRQKARNVAADIRATISINDPDAPYRYLELRGKIVAVDLDPDGLLFDALASRYGLHVDELPDRPTRVELVFEPTGVSWQ